MPLSVGESELTFFETDPQRKIKGEASKIQSAWFSVEESGQKLLQNLKKASSTSLSIYLHGETGTGKEILANQIHEWSDRAGGSFVAINCGALAVSLAESELFGHVKGSFTGAHRDRPGALLQAHQGTLFLDEIADLSLEVQVKLLRFLECGEIRPVGSDRVLHANVRVICATHKSLKKLVEEGKFRQDLYFRLASIPLQIPPLRSRPEDIKHLAMKYAREHQKTISEKAMLRLQSNRWLGNVRELRHAVERACGLAASFEPMLNESDFDFLADISGESDQLLEQDDVGITGICTFQQMEKVMVLRALKLSGGNRAGAARILNIARSTLFEMIKRHNIVGPRLIEDSKLSENRVAEKTI